MENKIDASSRREFLVWAGMVIAELSVLRAANAEPAGKTISLFDGRTLSGWLQIENNATSLSAGQITDPASFVARISAGSDAVSLFLRGQLEDSVRKNLTGFSPSNPDAKAVISGLVRNLNQVIAGASIYEKERFSHVDLEPETRELLRGSPSGQSLARLNMLLLNNAFPKELGPSPSTGWMVKDGAMTSTGAGRGVIYTDRDFSRYWLMFTMRHISGVPDHQACVLIFCTRSHGDEKPLDALGGIQFQVPNGGHWDYRVGMNKGGGAEFTSVTKAQFDVHAWSRIEILADATTGTASMAVAQPPGSRAVRVLDFKDPTAGKAGPIALQMHNSGLFDEYKDITIELDPDANDLLTTR